MKKTLALLCALAMMLVCVPGMAEETAAAPKYVFMFIGDAWATRRWLPHSTMWAPSPIPIPRFPSPVS